MTRYKTLEVLFPGRRRLLLAALFAEPERWWTVAELAGRAGLRPASLRSHICRLIDGGLIREKHSEGRSLLQADPTSPIYPELSSMLGKLRTEVHEGETILIVEDQPATARITRILLESWGYRVFEAHSGGEALSIFERHSGEIRLVLSDVIMPEMNGVQLAEELARRDPGVRIILMSGYPADYLNEANTAFLSKPFNPASLSRTVRKELDRPQEARRAG
jgi:CheY-like chemotaxis protein